MMRKILVSLILCVSFLSVKAQTPSGSKVRYQGSWYTCKDTATLTSSDTASIVYQCRDSSFYARALGYWKKIAISSGGFVQVSDTSAMLSKYLRKTDTANMVSPYLRKTDTSLMLSNRLKISDTTTMLSGYARSGKFVPYTGATTNVNIGSNSFIAGGVNVGYVSGAGGVNMTSEYTIANNPKSVYNSLGVSSILGGHEFRHSNGSGTGTITSAYANPNGTWNFYDSVIFSQQTASTVPYIDANKGIKSSSVTPTELGYVSGVTSSIQTQLNAKVKYTDTSSMLAPYLRGYSLTNGYVTISNPDGRTLNTSGNGNINSSISFSTDGALTLNTLTANTALYGTLATAAQTNITSLGTLSALTVTNSIRGGTGYYTNISGTLTTAAQPNITSIGNQSSVLHVIKSGNTGLILDNSSNNSRFQAFVGDGSGGYTADDNYIYNNNTDFHVKNNGGGVKLANGTTSWAADSDERLKADIFPIDSAIDKVLQLRTVIGRYKTDSIGVKRSFLIAQDVQKVFPYAVDVAKDSMQTLGVRYTELIPLALAAIKQQQLQIDNLRAQIDELKSILQRNNIK
jgi:hypothetical protein